MASLNVDSSDVSNNEDSDSDSDSPLSSPAKVQTTATTPKKSGGLQSDRKIKAKSGSNEDTLSNTIGKSYNQHYHTFTLTCYRAFQYASVYAHTSAIMLLCRP